jgi:ABC-2 type transport system ATP-binding protein
MNSVLSVDSLSKSFGQVRAVDGISFEVQEGDIFGILGPNGAGKSTILAMITGLVRSDTGTILLHGFDLKKSPRKAKKNLGVLNEVPGFYNHLSAADNLRLFGRFKGSTPTEIRDVLEKVGLSAKRNNKVRTFSQGMRKRLGLANALLGCPKLLILDEPTNGLDPKGTKVILDLIKSLSTEKKISVVISSNLLNDIEAVCGRALLIDKGRVLFCESVRDLLKPGENTYLLKVKPLDKALATLRSLDGVKSADYADEGSLSIMLSGLTAAELNRQLVNCGCDICEFSPAKKTLQELFLQLKDQ